MGAGASDTGKDNDLKGQPEVEQKARNYVPICTPPQYDLTFDSTDSEITELEQEQKHRHNTLPSLFHHQPKAKPIQERRSSIRESSINPISISIQEEEVPGEINEEGTFEIPEEQVTIGRYEEEQTVFPESIEEETKFIPLEEIPELTEEQTIEVETEIEQPPLVPSRSRNSILIPPLVPSRNSTLSPPQVLSRNSTLSPPLPPLPALPAVEEPPVTEEESAVVPLQRVRTKCNIKGICTNPELCKLKRCQRQVSFANEVQHCMNPACRKKKISHRRKSSSYEDSDEYEAGYDTDDDSDHFTESDGEGVMPDYQRYSREQPEKDQNGGSNKKAPDRGNMRDCCRPCCPNRTVSSKHNNVQQPLENRCSQGNRHSESYVSCRGQSKNPSHSKSVPNQLEERDSYSNFPGVDNPRSLPPRPHPPGRKSKPRTYPPGHSFEGRGDLDRPHIPLPPPQEHYSAEQLPAVPPHQHLRSSHQERESRDPRESRDSRDNRESRGQRDFRDLREQPLLEEQDERKEMYSHNTNRNYSTKKPYNRGYSNNNRQVLKPYPYEEPGGSTSYSHDSTCSNNCSGYDHCPMHHACRCQCHCMHDDQHYCGQTQSDDQMSCCSDSSNSECMNLAYQRTGDYPELMDELETTLSHRNRMRVQKTMQRFEMLSRQNKNLEKPIFEDDESLRHYNMNMSMHRDKNDVHECKCRSCMEKQRRRSFNTRSEALAKRPNYQPTPFPRNSGYVEKVARYMDPNLNNRRDNNPRKKMDVRHDMPSTYTNSNGTWQMDTRKNEWVKVDNGHSSNSNQYDFENSYPPLPPRPISEHMYDRRNYAPERAQCSCAKCLRRR